MLEGLSALLQISIVVASAMIITGIGALIWVALVLGGVGLLIMVMAIINPELVMSIFH